RAGPWWRWGGRATPRRGRRRRRRHDASGYAERDRRAQAPRDRGPHPDAGALRPGRRVRPREGLRDRAADHRGRGREQGKALAERMGGDSLGHFATALEDWKKGDAYRMDVLERSEEKLS